MSRMDAIAKFVTGRRKLTIAIVLLLTMAIGYGMLSVEQSQSLDQFESDSTEADKLTYIDENFGPDDDEQNDTTAVQIIIQGDNVLSKTSLLSTLELQQELRNDSTVNETLAEQPFGDISNLVATAAIRQDLGREIQAERAALNETREQFEAERAALNETREQFEAERAALNETRDELEAEQAALQQQQQAFNDTAGNLSKILNQTTALQGQYEQLNASYAQGNLTDQEYQAQASDIEDNLTALDARAQDMLDDGEYQTFRTLMDEMRSLVAERASIQAAFKRGEISESERDSQLADVEESIAAVYERIPSDVLGDRRAALQAQGATVQELATDLEERGETVQELGSDLEERGETVQELGSDLEERGETVQELAAQLEENPALDEQYEKLDSMNASAVEDVIGTVLGDDGPSAAFAFVPRDFEQGSTTAGARMMFLSQVGEGADAQGQAPDRLVTSQLQIQSLVENRYGNDAFVFGAGVVSDEIDRSFTDSIGIVTPLALLFVVLTLTIAYRDPIDIFLGTLGIALVLVWTFGFMGWAGIDFNQIFISVPVLLIGLSIDYAIHVFMRQREHREDGASAAEGMNVALAGIGVALVWVTLTGMIGFLSNVVSPIPPIQEFGITSAVGVLSALVIFGTLIPALKISLDNLLEAIAARLEGTTPEWSHVWPLTALYASVFDRRKAAFGTGGGPLAKLLSGGQVIAKRAPLVLVVLVVLVTAGATASATTIDTSFKQDDFLADDPPDFLKNNLPESMAPGSYSIKDNIQFVNDNFQRDDFQSQVLMEADGTPIDSPQALAAMNRSQGAATETDVIVVLSNGNADVESPLSVMESVARDNDSFRASFQQADADGDGVPDENVTALYDQLFETAPEQAQDVLYRTDDGSYEAARLVFSVRGDATSGEIRDGTRDVAAAAGDGGLIATATGQQIVFSLVEDALFDTVVQSLLITLVSVALFLIVAYRIYEGSATLGAVTMLPIALSVAWILGTMALLDIPFNVITGTITSLTIGLGIAYNIHMSERFRLERSRGYDVWEALSRAVTGTGGALLGSAATTIGGFGVLAFAIIPVLQQFGIVTGLTIAYAFLGSVLVLPTLLVLWSGWADPDAVDDDQSDEATAETVPEDDD